VLRLGSLDWERRRSLVCERQWVSEALSEATLRESSSMRSSNPAVWSSAVEEMIAVTG